ncbi:MAG: hypothetical protein AABX76_00610 [Nanoarchaeota archaeon]
MDKSNDDLEVLSTGLIPFKKNGTLDVGELTKQLNRYASDRQDLRVEIEYNPVQGFYYFELYRDNDSI